MDKLYIEVRIHVNPQMNQDLLHEIGEQLQEQIPQFIECNDVTFEVVRETNKGESNE